MLAVRRETMLVVWYRASSGARNSFEGSVDVREIKEIRPGEGAFINDVTQIWDFLTIPPKMLDDTIMECYTTDFLFCFVFGSYKPLWLNYIFGDCSHTNQSMVQI